MADSDPSPPPARPTEDPPRSPFGHRVMFVLLVLLSFVVFAPTLLLPLLQEYCDLRAEEVRLEERIEDLRDEITRRDHLINAFTRDKEIVERLARLDLRFRKPGEVVMPILPEPAEPDLAREEASLAATPERQLLELPRDWPAWAHRARQWADHHGLLAVFLNGNVRPVFYLMSAGLLIAAFVLFFPRTPPSPTPKNDGDPRRLEPAP